MNSPLPPDPYEVLGVAKDATTANIKTAYRKLALQTHPDKVQDESLRAQKADEFQRVQEAYETLTDETKKQQYEDQIRLAKLRKSAAAAAAAASADAFRTTGFRFEVRTAGFEVRTAAPRDYDKVYEQRRAARSFEDDIGYFADRSSSRKHDAYASSRRPSRSYEERRTSHSFEENRPRPRTEHNRQRAHERGYQSERKKSRTKDRRREFDDKYARAAFDDDDDSDRYQPRASTEEPPSRRHAEKDMRRDARASDESIRRESTRRHLDDEIHDSERKLSNAREYMQRSTRLVTEDASSRSAAPHRSSPSTSTYAIRPTAPVPPSPGEDTVRRSRARRSTDRDPSRGTERHRSSRKESSRGPIGIVEPPDLDSKPRSMPHLPHSSSSPSALKAALHATNPRRSTTMEYVQGSRSEIPPLPRAATMPVGESSTSRRRETSKLKTETFDSGYSSPGTPDAGPSHRTSPGPSTRRSPEYIVVETAEPAYSSRSSRRREAYVESESETESETDSEYEVDLREHSSRRQASSSKRPTLFREIPSGGRGSSGRSSSYAYVEDGMGPTLLRAEPVTPSRPSPTFLRTGSGFSPRGSSYSRADSGHGRKAIYDDVQFSPKIKREDIVYSHSRRGSDESPKYRDAPPYHHHSDYGHGPHHGYLRAETSR